MTAAMWLAWLLRTDVRAGRDPASPAAQQDFTAWWILRGQQEYPRVWWYGPSQWHAVMDPALSSAAPLLPALLLKLHQTRLDLQQAFDLTQVEGAAEYLCWYRLSGPQELPVAPALSAAFMAVTEAASTHYAAPSVSRMALALWSRSSELQAIIDPQIAGHRAGLCRWYEAHGVHAVPLPTPLPDWAEIRPVTKAERLSPRPSHVRLVGYARAEFGIGEDVRMVSRALEAGGLDHSITDLPIDQTVRSLDMSRAAWVRSQAGAAICIFCLTGFDTGQLFLNQGLTPFEGGYNVGYWPWELPRFPDAWIDVYGLVDEIWAASTFQAQAYAANSPVPVRLMPPAVMATSRQRVRRSSKRRTYVFIYPFDPKSTLARKNPVAAIHAFRLAFPQADRSVRLVLRVNGQGAGQSGWNALRAARAGDRRIHIVEGTLPRLVALRLLQEADCLVSPHRAEGLGRNIAEAIALGTSVLATGFSGSGDLLQKHERIGSKPRRVLANEYPHAVGLSWSEPNRQQLKRCMQKVRQNSRRLTEAVFVRRAKDLLTEYGIQAASDRYLATIHNIMGSLGECNATPANSGRDT